LKFKIATRSQIGITLLDDRLKVSVQGYSMRPWIYSKVSVYIQSSSTSLISNWQFLGALQNDNQLRNLSIDIEFILERLNWTKINPDDIGGRV